MDFDVTKRERRKREDEMRKRDVTKKNTLGRMRKWGKMAQKVIYFSVVFL